MVSSHFRPVSIGENNVSIVSATLPAIYRGNPDSVGSTSYPRQLSQHLTKDRAVQGRSQLKTHLIQCRPNDSLAFLPMIDIWAAQT